ncbi:MAG TPA: YdcF family protein [Chitinophaga sp.]
MSDINTSILIVLGAPNSPEGLLSPIAISRLDTCFSIYQQEGSYILLTGGYGPHFNTTEKPHTWYARQYLKGKGVPSHKILDSVESSNTVEDATLSKPLITILQPSLVTIITSEFHLQRAGLIFCDIYQNIVPLRFIAAPSYELRLEELQALMKHEAKALQNLMTNGIKV